MITAAPRYHLGPSLFLAEILGAILLYLACFLTWNFLVYFKGYLTPGVPMSHHSRHLGDHLFLTWNFLIYLILTYLSCVFQGLSCYGHKDVCSSAHQQFFTGSRHCSTYSLRERAHSDWVLQNLWRHDWGKLLKTWLVDWGKLDLGELENSFSRSR
jgi:hypothetical protein